jgi:hypothetical protein
MSGAIQRFICGDCNKAFSINLGFEKINHSSEAVTTKIELHFSWGYITQYTKIDSIIEC